MLLRALSRQVVLFRRDLRLSDHQPLTEALRALRPGDSLVPLYVYEPELVRHPTILATDSRASAEVREDGAPRADAMGSSEGGARR